jgi:hypothetical protein
MYGATPRPRNERRPSASAEGRETTALAGAKRTSLEGAEMLVVAHRARVRCRWRDACYWPRRLAGGLRSRWTKALAGSTHLARIRCRHYNDPAAVRPSSRCWPSSRSSRSSRRERSTTPRGCRPPLRFGAARLGRGLRASRTAGARPRPAGLTGQLLSITAPSGSGAFRAPLRVTLVELLESMPADASLVARASCSRR